MFPKYPKDHPMGPWSNRPEYPKDRPTFPNEHPW